MKNRILTIIVMLFSLSLTACALNVQKNEPIDRREKANSNMSKERLFDRNWYFEPLASEVKVSTPSKAFITFEKNGRVSGFSGCNRFQGTAKVNDSLIRIGPLGSTRKACPSIMSYEAKILKMLRQANKYVLRDERLELYKDETKLGVLN